MDKTYTKAAEIVLSNHACAHLWKRKVLPSVGVALAYMALQAGHAPALITTFFERLGDGVNLSEGNAILILRSKMDGVKAQTNHRGRLQALEQLVMAIRAFNAWIKRDKLKTLYGSKVSSGHTYPRVVTFNPRATFRQEGDGE